MSAVDVLVVSVDSTGGWRISTGELVAALRRAGATVEHVHAGPVPQVRTFALTDFVQARAARAAVRRALADHAPRAIVYCSITAALLWPRPGAIWLDAIAAENRPGRHGVWQRPTERLRLRQTPLVLAMSEHSLDPLTGPRAATIVVPVPIEPSGPATEAARDILALAYAGDPDKRRLDYILGSWARARRPGETLVVTGIDREERIDGVEFTGRLDPAAYRALVRRARLFIAAPRREDYGIAALEALADGCLLVGAPAPGPYPALRLARTLDPRLIDADLPTAIRAGLDRAPDDYPSRALALLAPFRREHVDRVLGEQVLPRLIGG